MQTLLKNEGRKAYLDLARIIAALAVVMVHVSADFVTSYPHGSVGYLAGCIFDALSRLGVTFFVMISGVLMLDESKDIPSKKFAKYIRNILTLFLAWSLIYALAYGVFIPLSKGTAVVSGKEFIRSLFFGHYHMWYLLMIIGLYAITPVLRLIAQKQHAKKVLFLIVLSMSFQGVKLLHLYLCQFYPALGAWNEFINKFHADYLVGYIAYYLMGWYIVNVGITKKWRTAIYALGGVGIVCTILLTQIRPFAYGIAFYELSPLNFFFHIALFDSIVQYYKGGDKLNSLLQKGGKLTFGVYMVHVIVLYLYDCLFTSSYNAFLCIPIKWLAVCAVSFGFTYLLSKIPFLKKLTRG